MNFCSIDFGFSKDFKIKSSFNQRRYSSDNKDILHLEGPSMKKVRKVYLKDKKLEKIQTP
jgi:hypothetical protein